MFTQKLIEAVGGEARGWKSRAADYLKVSRPTLDRYLGFDADGEPDKIPANVLEKLSLSEAALFQNAEAKAPQPIAATPRDMVHLFAAGLSKLQEHIDQFGHIQAPYPPHLSRAFNLASALNIAHGYSYPVDLASLIVAASKRLYEWCPEYCTANTADDLIDKRLVEDGDITPDCLVLAALADGDAEEHFYAALMGECRAMEEKAGQAFYSAWRRAVIENPVLESHSALLSRYDELRSNVLATNRLINVFYEYVPAIHAHDGLLALCPVTRTRLKRCSERWISEFRDPIAANQIGQQGPHYIQHTPNTLELRRPVRIFWALPGWHELQLHNALIERGCKSVLWPDLDAVDLLVSVPGSDVRYAVDVKDHISPASLGRTINHFKRYRRHSRVVVVPDYLLERLPEYRRLFEQARRSALKEPLQLLMSSEFLRLVERAVCAR